MLRLAGALAGAHEARPCAPRANMCGDNHTLQLEEDSSRFSIHQVCQLFILKPLPFGIVRIFTMSVEYENVFLPLPLISML